MASEYKCDICGKPATVHITRIIDDKKVKIHLCNACASKVGDEGLNLPKGILPTIKKLEENLFKEISSKSDKSKNVCPACGANLEAIEKGDRFSCPECYNALKSKLFELLAQMHSATKHTGKQPKRFVPSKPSKSEKKTTPEIKIEESERISLDDILEELVETIPPMGAQDALLEKDDKTNLLKKLSKAISEERYEDAAILRDKLKELASHASNA